MSDREWTDASDWNLRHQKPGAQVRASSIGAVETGDEGNVLRVSGRYIETRTPDPAAGKVVVSLTKIGDAPSRGDLLAAGYLDRAQFPLKASDLETPEESKAPKASKKTGSKKTSKKAKTTKVSARKRDEVVEPAPGDPELTQSGNDSPTASSGEMGIFPDTGLDGPSGDGDGDPPAAGYENPFTEGTLPAGTSATDPAFNPPEGAPHGGAVRSLIRDGRVEVLDT